MVSIFMKEINPLVSANIIILNPLIDINAVGIASSSNINYVLSEQYSKFHISIVDDYEHVIIKL